MMRRLFSRYPLRVVIISTIVLLLLLTAGTTWFLTFRNGRASVQEFTEQIGSQSMSSIRQHLKSYLSAPAMINRINGFAFGMNDSRLVGKELMIRRFLAEIAQFDTVISISYANAEGDYYGITRGVEGIPLGLTVSDRETNHFLEGFQTDSEGRRLGLVARSSDIYDPRQRPWYRDALEAGMPKWTPVYLWTNEDVGIDAVTPVYDPGGNLQGVLDTSLTLKGMGVFIDTLKATPHTKAFILDRLGMVVAASSISKPYSVKDGVLERLFASDSTDPVVRSAGAQISKMIATGTTITGERHLTVQIGGQRNTVFVSPFQNGPGIDWFIVEVVPESDYAQQIYQDTRSTVIFVAIALLLSVIIALMLARRVTAPLELLNTMARSLAAGELTHELSLEGTDEVGQLATSFNVMAEELRRSFENLSASEARYRAIFHRSAVSLWEIDTTELRKRLNQLRDSGHKDLESYINGNPEFLAQGVQIVRVVDVNETTLKLFEAKSREELLGPIGNTLDSSSLSVFAPKAMALAESGHQHDLETTVLTRTGRRLNVIMHFHVPAEHDPFGHTLVSVIDITKRVQAEEERALLEDQLRHSQKMESVGHLAGGISHDINNLLTPILGYSQVLLEDSIPNKRELVESIIGAAGRIRDLTQKLLTFSRKQRLAKSVADLRTVVKDFEILLRQTVRKNVDLRIDLPGSLGMTKVDVGQIEQVVMNLAINAQDAMPDGGTLNITLRDVILDEDWARTHCGFSPGDYVALTVSDTGTGMDEATRRRVFEPFFTTKEPGKGTGLGLSTVYGIVRQHGGHIEIDSQKGWGTVFSIYFPRHVSPMSEDIVAQASFQRP